MTANMRSHSSRPHTRSAARLYNPLLARRTPPTSSIRTERLTQQPAIAGLPNLQHSMSTSPLTFAVTRAPTLTHAAPSANLHLEYPSPEPQDLGSQVGNPATQSRSPNRRLSSPVSRLGSPIHPPAISRSESVGFDHEGPLAGPSGLTVSQVGQLYASDTADINDHDEAILLDFTRITGQREDKVVWAEELLRLELIRNQATPGPSNPGNTSTTEADSPAVHASHNQAISVDSTVYDVSCLAYLSPGLLPVTHSCISGPGMERRGNQ